MMPPHKNTQPRGTHGKQGQRKPKAFTLQKPWERPQLSEPPPAEQGQGRATMQTLAVERR